MEPRFEPTQFPLPPEGAHGPAPGLEGMAGRLRLGVGGLAVGTLEVGEGEVSFHRGDAGEADAIATCDSAETLRAITDGTLNPVVAALQDRLELSGDRWFAIRVVLGLMGSSPLRQPAREH